MSLVHSNYLSNPKIIIMKNVLFVAALLISLNVFAGATEIADNDIENVIVDMIAHEVPFKNFDLEGIVTIQFTLDECNKIHITDINGANAFLVDHVIASLENKVINGNAAVPGVVYTLRLQYIQYS